MRDPVMSEACFLDYLSEEEARAARLRAKPASGTIRPDRVPSMERRPGQGPSDGRRPLQALPYYPPDLAHYAAPSENC